MFEQVHFRVASVVFVITLLLLSFFTLFNVYREQQRAEAELLRKGEMLAFAGASTLSRLMENTIESGQKTRDEIFDTDYVRIPGSDPPRFHTSYDEFLEREIQDILDAFQRDDEVVFAVLADRKGYLPAHNTNFAHRAKRIFDDEVGLTAAENKEGYLKQVYYRDTEEKMWDISYPVFVHGEHWGAFRIGFSMEMISQKKWDIFLETIISMGAITIIIGCSTYFIARKAISPLA